MQPYPLADLEHILQHAEPDLRALAEGPLFLSGATGFFGSWLVAALAHANQRLRLDYQVVALSRNPDAFKARYPHLAFDPMLRFVTGDVRSFEFPNQQFTNIIHAATGTLGAEAPLELFDTVILGTRRMAEFAAVSGAQRLLFTSSGAVYGAQAAELTHLPEDYAGAPDPMLAQSIYGEAKRAAEMCLVAASQNAGFEVKIARCFAFLGPGLPLDAHFAAGNFIADAVAGKPVLVRGDGSPWRAYLYPADLVIWLLRILLAGRNQVAYNVGSDHGLPIGDLALLIAQATHTKVTILESPRPGAPVSRYVPQVERARSELGLEVLIALDDAIQRCVMWHGGTAHRSGVGIDVLQQVN